MCLHAETMTIPLLTFQLKKSIRFYLLLLLIYSYLLSTGQRSNTAFVHSTVIDIETGKLFKNYTVMISGNKIISVRPSSKSNFKADNIVNATGKYIIPGLWDMHVHTDASADFEHAALPLFIANGVTGIRDMGSENDNWKRWRNMPDSLVTPRIFAAGKIIDGPREGGSQFHERIEVSNAKEAKQAVDSITRIGADFVKVHERIALDAYKAVIKEAKIKHLDVAGHVPVTIDARIASSLGQKCIEHLGNSQGGFLVECSKKEDDLRNERRELARKPVNSTDFANSIKADKVYEQIVDFDSSKAVALARLLSKNNTWQDPTLVILKYVIPDSSFTRNPLFKYLSFDDQAYIKRSPTKWWTQFGLEDKLAWQRKFDLQMKLTGLFNKSGVKMLTGSDVANENITILPGFSIHDELSLLVQAGLSPLQSLQAATLNPARYFGRTDKFGTIKAGRWADFILLDANPLSNIKNTRSISGVVINGRYLDRMQLDGLLLKVGTNNSHKL